MKRWTGGIPYGYMYNPDTGDLNVNEEEKHVLNIIFKLASEGKGVNQISNYLNSQNKQSRRKLHWSNVTVGYLLTVPRLNFYMGYDSNGQKGEWTPLIDEKTVKNILRFKQDTIPRRGKQTYLLSNMNVFFCGYCDSTVKTSVTTKGDAKNVYYICTSRQMKGVFTCPNSKLHRQGVLDDLILTDLKVKSSKNLEKFYNAYVKKKKEELESRLKDLPELSDKVDQYLNLVRPIIREIERLNDYKFKIKTKKINTLDIKSLRKIIKEYISKIVLFNNHLEIHYKYPYNEDLKFVEILKIETD